MICQELQRQTAGVLESGRLTSVDGGGAVSGPGGVLAALVPLVDAVTAAVQGALQVPDARVVLAGHGAAAALAL